MPKDNYEARRMSLSMTRRMIALHAARAATMRKRDPGDGGALQPADKPKVGAGGAAAELEPA